MKNFFIVLSLVLFIFLINKFVNAGNIFYPMSYDVSISSTPKIVANKLENRCYFLAVNLTSNYDIRIASWNIKPSDTGGIYLNRTSGLAAGGWWEDSYYVYNSTWYAVIVGTLTETGTISITEKE